MSSSIGPSASTISSHLPPDPPVAPARPAKRRRTTKACQQCRKQKSRCEHSHDDDYPSVLMSNPNSNSNFSSCLGLGLLEKWEEPCHRCKVLGLDCSLVQEKRQEKRELAERLGLNIVTEDGGGGINSGSDGPTRNRRDDGFSFGFNARGNGNFHAGGSHHRGPLPTMETEGNENGTGNMGLGYDNQLWTATSPPPPPRPLPPPQPVTSSYSPSTPIPPPARTVPSMTDGGDGGNTLIHPMTTTTSQDFHPYGSSSNFGASGGGDGLGRADVRKGTGPVDDESLSPDEGRRDESGLGNDVLVDREPQSQSEIRQRFMKITPIQLSYRTHLSPKNSNPSPTSPSGDSSMSNHTGGGRPVENNNRGGTSSGSTSADSRMHYPILHPPPISRMGSHRNSTTSSSLAVSSSTIPSSNPQSSSESHQTAREPASSSSRSSFSTVRNNNDTHDDIEERGYRDIAEMAEQPKLYAPLRFLGDLLRRGENHDHSQNRSGFSMGPGIAIGSGRFLSERDRVQGEGRLRKRLRDDDEGSDRAALGPEDCDVTGEGEGDLGEDDHGKMCAHYLSDRDLLGRKGDTGWFEEELFDKGSLRALSEIFNDHYSPWAGFRVRPNNLGSRSFLGAVCLYLATRHCSKSSSGGLSAPPQNQDRPSSLVLATSLVTSLHNRLTAQLTRAIFAPTRSISTVWGLNLLARWTPVDLLSSGEGGGSSGAELWDGTNLMGAALKAAKSMDIDMEGPDGRVYMKLTKTEPEDWRSSDVEEAKLWFSLCVHDAFLSILRDQVVCGNELASSTSLKLVETILGPPRFGSTSAYTGLVFCTRILHTLEDICKTPVPASSDKATLDQFAQDHLRMTKEVDSNLKSFSRFSTVARPEDVPYYMAFTLLGHFSKGYACVRGLMMLNTLAHNELSTSQPVWRRGLDNPFHTTVNTLAVPMGDAIEEAVMIAVSPAFPVKALSTCPDFILSAITFSACIMVKWHLSLLDFRNHDRPDAPERFNILVKLTEKMQEAALSKNDLNWRYARLLTAIVKIWREKAREVTLNHECSDECPPWAASPQFLPSSQANPNTNRDSDLPPPKHSGNVGQAQNSSFATSISIPSQTAIPLSTVTVPPVNQFPSGELGAGLDGFDFGSSWDFQSLLGGNPLEYDIFESLFADHDRTLWTSGGNL